MSTLPIYLDNAATSWPKAPAVFSAMKAYMEDCGGSPGRAAHGKSLDSSRMVYDARELLATMFHCTAAERVIFTKNATEAMNMVLFGLLDSGDHVVTSSMEHNAVMRPLRHLETKGIRITAVPCDSCGRLDPAAVKQALTPQTKLIVLTHASNVAGTILPIGEIGLLAREAGIRFAVDASQTAGICPIDVHAMGIDFLVFTGHKSLGGPQGTGGLVLGPDVDLRPLLFGGTGSASESEHQPDFLPDKLESGTLNAVGIAGLYAATQDLLTFGISKVLDHERHLTKMLREGFRALPGVTVYGPEDSDACVGVTSINVSAVPCTDVGVRLERDFGILTRTGLHCAPAAHHTLGTFEIGTVRFSVSRFTTEAEVQAAITAVAHIAKK